MKYDSGATYNTYTVSTYDSSNTQKIIIKDYLIYNV